MGEQSAKHLRGKAMEDVIFAGSETRGPAPMAEVSLTFDDVGFSHETLELAQHSDERRRPSSTLDGARRRTSRRGRRRRRREAQARGSTPRATRSRRRRKKSRSCSPTSRRRSTSRATPRSRSRAGCTATARSQYFINKTPCRLRDITDFFLGTGVGTKAYAIIEQGRDRPDRVSSRPQDRRAIIEEAAGITKFKAKKKAAEKKLDQTRQNLMRVSDIVAELDKRMGTLRRQAQKAERYRKYKAELRDIELWKASHRWLELRAEAPAGRARGSSDAHASSRTRAPRGRRKDAHVVAERAELAVEERRLVGVQEQVYELDNRLRLGESKIGFERREADELDARIAPARDEIDEIARAARARRAPSSRRGRPSSRRSRPRSSASTAEVAAREAAAGEARADARDAQRRLDEARAELAHARAPRSRPPTPSSRRSRGAATRPRAGSSA